MGFVITAVLTDHCRSNATDRPRSQSEFFGPDSKPFAGGRSRLCTYRCRPDAWQNVDICHHVYVRQTGECSRRRQRRLLCTRRPRSGFVEYLRAPKSVPTPISSAAAAERHLLRAKALRATVKATLRTLQGTRSRRICSANRANAQGGVNAALLFTRRGLSNICGHQNRFRRRFPP